MPAAAYRAIVDTYFGASPYHDLVDGAGTQPMRMGETRAIRQP